MKEHIRTEEQQKDLIFDIFLNWQNSTSSDRTQTYFLQLCEQIYKWYKDYRPQEKDNMGLETTKVIDNFLKKGKKLNIPKDKNGFFAYLNKSLINEKAGSKRGFNEKKLIRIPKDVNTRLKKLREYITWEESQLGRKLTIEELNEEIAIFFKEQAYIDLLNIEFISSLSYAINGEDEELDGLNIYVNSSSVDPLDEYINKTDTETVKEAVTSVLRKKQERARPCYKALFTLHCIKNNLNDLFSILDQEILDSFNKEGKKPKQYEIYQKYHPGIEQNSAEAEASTNLRQFLNDIKTYLKEKINNSPQKP